MKNKLLTNPHLRIRYCWAKTLGCLLLVASLSGALYAQTNIALTGTGAIWQNIAAATSTSNSSKSNSTGINNSDLNTDVGFSDVTTVNNWQAAGITWASTQSGITSVKFYNGFTANIVQDNGVFSAGIKLQSSTDGSSWADVSGWTITPAYSYSVAASNQIYVFSGNALNNVKGIRVVGQLRTAANEYQTSWAVRVKEVQVFTSSTPVSARRTNLGMNLANPGMDYTTDKYFADAMRSHRECSKISGGSDNANKDANYWPTEDCKFLVWAGLNTQNNHGTYKLYFTGQATVVADGGAISNQAYNASTNQSTADMVISDPNNEVLYLTFINTKRTAASATNTGVTNVKLMRPVTPGGTTAHAPSVLFMPEAITQLAPFKCLRSIGWVAVNWNQDSLWSDRTTMLMARQSPPTGGKPYGWEGRGASYESLILFANQAQKDVWLTIPHKVTDDYIAKLAQLFKYGSNGVTPYTSTQANPVYPPLNSNLKLYLENSNEVWNDQFSQTSWTYAKAATTAAVKFDGSTDQYEWGMRYKAYRTAQISMLFRNVFGSDMMTRIRPVLSFQKGYIARTSQSLNFIDSYFNKRDSRSPWNDPHPVNYYIWGAGGTFYWNTNGSVNTSTIWTSGSWDVTASYSDEWGNPGGYYDLLSADASWAKAFGLAYVNYEGDMHPQYDGDEVTIRALKSGTWDNRLKQNTLDHLNVLNKVDAELSLFLVLNAADGSDWGIRNVTHPSNSPQLDAVNIFNGANPMSVTYGTLAPFTRPGNSWNTNSYQNPNLNGTGSTNITANDPEYSRSYAFRVPSTGSYNVRIQYKTSANAKLIVEFAGNVVGTYNLTSTGGTLATTASANFSASADKLYSIRVIATQGSIDIENIIVGSGTNAREASTSEENDGNAVSVYPNPATGHIYINTGVKEGGSISITDLEGKLIKSLNTDTQVSMLSIAELNSGIYIVTIKSANSKAHKQLIVE